MEPVGVFPDYIEAEIVCQRLRAAGIAAILLDDHASTALPLFGPALGGVKVLVPSEQAGEARAELAVKEEVAAPTCPECGSPSVEERSWSRWASFLSILCLGLPVGGTRRRFVCGECAATWSP